MIFDYFIILLFYVVISNISELYDFLIISISYASLKLALFSCQNR